MFYIFISYFLCVNNVFHHFSSIRILRDRMSCSAVARKNIRQAIARHSSRHRLLSRKVFPSQKTIFIWTKSCCVVCKWKCFTKLLSLIVSRISLDLCFLWSLATFTPRNDFNQCERVWQFRMRQELRFIVSKFAQVDDAPQSLAHKLPRTSAPKSLFEKYCNKSKL